MDVGTGPEAECVHSTSAHVLRRVKWNQDNVQLDHIMTVWCHWTLGQVWTHLNDSVLLAPQSFQSLLEDTLSSLQCFTFHPEVVGVA